MTQPQITEVGSIDEQHLQSQEQVGTTDEQHLQSQEQIIESGLGVFYQVGLALKEIRDKKLYKLQGYHSFNDYCEEHWEIGKRYAYMQIESSTVMENLRTSNPPFLPTTEWQVRPLTKLNPQQQRQVWEKIVASVESGGGEPKVTAALVEKMVSEATAQTKDKEEKSIPVGEKVVYKVSLNINTNNSLNDFFDHIRHLLDKQGKVVSKERMIEALLQVALQELENKGKESLVAKVARLSNK
jgi:hypothetical protein